jgi:hypothetical protein
MLIAHSSGLAADLIGENTDLLPAVTCSFLFEIFLGRGN